MGWIIERGMVPVNCEIAIFDLKGALAPQDKPLMLQPVLFCPVLTWAAQELMDCGVQRYFIVCPEKWRQEVLDDLPGCDVTFFDHAEAALSAAGGDVVMVPGPVVPVYGPEDGRSVYAADSQVLLARLRAGTPLTDCPAEAAGVRSLWRPQALAPAFRPFDSAAALADARELILRRLAENGVTVVDPAATYVDPRCSVAPGVTLLPGTILRGHTAVDRDSEIGPNSMLRDCRIGQRTTVNASQLNESTIGDGVKIGPFAYIRPNCHVGPGVKVGDFVELKNSTIGEGTKISHLTYVGDSDVGGHVNFGCGTVTVNYDGTSKFRTVIGDHAFIGCNTNLVAPVRVGEGAYTAAGSTITDEVPADSLAIARTRQTVKKQWAAKRRNRRK